jgi:hypothetical protein
MRESNSTFVFEKTLGSSSYFTFASGGYIIKMSPIAMGIEVDPILIDFRNPEKEGISFPRSTPRAIAVKIHSVRYLSKNESFFVIHKRILADRINTIYD